MDSQEGRNRQGIYSSNVRGCIKEIIDGPGSMGGYRTIWHTLEMEGIKVPRLLLYRKSSKKLTLRGLSYVNLIV